MNYKILLFSFVALLVNEQCHALDGYILDVKNDARLYMAAFLQNNGTKAWISCTGTFIKENYILTAASCVQGDMHLIDPRSGVVNMYVVGSGNRHIIQEVYSHPQYDSKRPNQNNITVVKVMSEIKPIEKLEPRLFYKIKPNRICTMFGWEGHNTNQDFAMPLRMYAVPLGSKIGCDRDVPEAYCSMEQLNSNYKRCGGLMGAPIFCTGKRISGIVVNDKFCKGPNPVGGSFISLGDYRDFINDILNPVVATTKENSAGNVTVTKLLMLISLLILFKNFF